MLPPLRVPSHTPPPVRSNSLLAAQNSTDNVSILREHIMRKAYANNVAAIQVRSELNCVRSLP